MNLVTSIVVIVAIGVGATVVMDLWGLVRKQTLGVPAPDYGMVGRWIGHMPRGRFAHKSIAASRPVRGEQFVGWTVHYLIGVAYAALLIAIVGPDWLREPTLIPPLLVGVGTVVAPFFIMQPGMGAGVAASRTPNPMTARIQSLLNHFVFGLGLYVSALVVSRIVH